MSGSVYPLSHPSILMEEPFAVGACTVRSSLTLAVVSKASGRFVLADDGLIRFPLENRGQIAANDFVAGFRKWIHDYEIETVWLRAAPYSGKMCAAPSSYKIEALLQTVLAVEVRLVDSIRLNRWQENNALEVGGAYPEGWKRSDVQARDAITMAVYALEHCDHRSDAEGCHA